MRSMCQCAWQREVLSMCISWVFLSPRQQSALPAPRKVTKTYSIGDEHEGELRNKTKTLPKITTIKTSNLVENSPAWRPHHSKCAIRAISVCTQGEPRTSHVLYKDFFSELGQRSNSPSSCSCLLISALSTLMSTTNPIYLPAIFWASSRRRFSSNTKSRKTFQHCHLNSAFINQP